MPQGSELGSVLLFLLTNKKFMQTTKFLLYHKNQRKQILTRYLNQTKQFCSDYVDVVQENLVSIKQFSDTNTSQTWGSSAEWATKLDGQKYQLTSSQSNLFTTAGSNLKCLTQFWWLKYWLTEFLLHISTYRNYCTANMWT